MDVNLLSFGKTLREIREELHLTQNDVSLLSGINSETIRRIEYGRVIPKFETLDLLSITYNQDLNALFLEYRIDDYAYFYYLKNKLERKFDRDEFYTLHNELKELKLFLKYTNNLFYNNLITQLILLTESVILYKDNLNYDMALNKLIEAIKITTPDFNLDDYKSFVYPSMEIRILMNMAFILNKLNHNEKYLEIMNFCVKEVAFNDSLYPKLCYNLAGAYYRNKDYKKALEHSNMGIKACQENRNFDGLSLLYYIKGIAEYRLDCNEYMESLNKSIILCGSFGQDNLKSKIIDNCRKFLDVEL